jgi:hypothetical protein
VPLGLEEEPSAAEQSQTATVVRHSTKSQRIKSCKFSKHKASPAGLEGILFPNGDKCAGVGCKAIGHRTSCNQKINQYVDNLEEGKIAYRA